MASNNDAALMATARKRWAKCSDAEDQQRGRIIKAKQFRALDQWPSDVASARKGMQSAIPGMAPAPARPCLVVDRLSQPVRQVSNTIKNADFGFDVLPNGGGADIETADILKGYLRRVHNQARGESPVEWAADQAIEGGIGWFRLRTDYVHTYWDGEPTIDAFDQEIRMERIANNLTVYCDPSANKPTRCDAQYMFVTEDFDREEFLDLYDADVRGLDEFQGKGDMPGWVSNDSIRIAEYWRIEYESVTIWILEDGTGGVGPVPKGVTPKVQRVMRRPKVKGCKINACEVISKRGGGRDEWDWVGSYIPLIPILGEELNVDGKAVLRGIIEMGMDAQRMVNYTYSAGVEIFALGSKAPYIAAAESVANYKSIWQTANTFNYAYLPYDEYIDGRQFSKPQRDQAEAPIQAAVMLMRTSEDAIKASTSTGDASLGNTNPNERSGRALAQLQQQSDLANSNYPDNVRRALIYAAELMVEVIPKITRPGQILHIMGLDDEPDQVMVGQAFEKGPDGVPVKSEIPPEVAKMKESLASFYDLTKGKYSTTVTVGKASATRREEGAMALGQLIPHLPPEMAAVATPDYVRQLSFPGAQKIAEKIEKALPPHLQPNPEGGEKPPDPAMLMQQLQQLQQQLQQAGQIIQTKQVEAQAGMQEAQLKAQADNARAQLDAQTKLEIARMDNLTKLQIEEWKVRGMAMQAEIDAQQAAFGAAQQQQAQQASQAHEAGLAAAGAESQAAEAAAARDAQAQQAEADRAMALEQQAAQAQQGPVV